jgi:hypothetical protein
MSTTFGAALRCGSACGSDGIGVMSKTAFRREEMEDLVSLFAVAGT